MFNRRSVQPALLSALVVLLFVTITSVPGSSLNPPTKAAPAAAPAVAPAVAPAATPLPPPCNLITPFNSNNFPDPPVVNNVWYPLVPGMQFTLEGRANTGGQPLPHKVIFTVTDLTKVVHGVRTVVLWDRDFNQGVLTEAELAFHAQDNAGNIWNLGEYPEEYSGGVFSGAPDVWISGLASAQGGTLLLGNQQLGTPVFLQAYAPDIIGDCGQVSAVGQQHVCISLRCYDNVLVIDETSPPEPGTQQKYYAPGVGNFRIGAVNDPQGETLELTSVVQLSPQECAAARAAALALEAHAYQVRPDAYGQTAPAQHTATCAAPTPTATVTGTPPTATSTRTPTRTPTATPQRTLDRDVYMALVGKPRPEPTATPTPTVPPQIFDNCKSDPNPAGASNFPVRIVKVDKVAEVVTLQNVSTVTVSVEDWNMCSINGNQEHDQIFGTLAPGQTRDFPNTGGGPIWNDTERDDGALYNAAGFLVSYWVDQ